MYVCFLLFSVLSMFCFVVLDESFVVGCVRSFCLLLFVSFDLCLSWMDRYFNVLLLCLFVLFVLLCLLVLVCVFVFSLS